MKLKLPPLKSRDEFTAAVDEVARITVELRKLEARRDAKIQAIQAEFSEPVAALQAQCNASIAQAEKFAADHQCELMLGKARSAETALARYGFRTGMPQLKLLAKNTWEKVLDTLRRRSLFSYIRVKEEVDKAAILRDEFCLDLGAIGVRVVQAEAFYIEPKLDDANQVKSTAAK